jgi:2-oxoglutarate dehydrogenase E2 component (dihydrolipoamide succinyltransferase)
MATGTAVEVVMPQMGVSVSEGTVTKWLKSEGESIAVDEPLLEISTDKVDTEVPSPASGTVSQILVQEGETVEVGTAIAVIEPGGTRAENAAPAEEPAAPATQAPPAAAAPAAPPPAAGEEDSRVTPARAFVSPVVSRIAAEHGVDVSTITGTGRGGRVTKKDIVDHLEARGITVPPSDAAPPPPSPPAPAPAPSPPTPTPAAPPPAPSAPAAAPSAPSPPPPSPQAQPADDETIEPMSVMRRAIAEHMVRSVHTSAHVTTVFEIDMSKVVAIRNRLKTEAEQRHGVRLTFLAFIARAVVDGIGKWPRINAEIRDDQVVLKRSVNLGIAVALDDGKGLIVPVIRSAEEKNLLGIARAIHDLADRARSKKLLPDEVQGGTFTITNPGGFGAIAGTPIINQPQVAILDVDAIVKRPVVVSDELGNDSIAIRPMMNLCLSYDHRLVDGAYAAPFLRDVKTNLETWEEDAY